MQRADINSRFKAAIDPQKRSQYVNSDVVSAYLKPSFRIISWLLKNARIGVEGTNFSIIFHDAEAKNLSQRSSLRVLLDNAQ